MKILALLALAVLAGAYAPARAGEVAALVVVPVVAQPIAWGQAENNLQLGVRFDDKFRDHRVGETAMFALVVRNLGTKTLSFSYITPLFSEPFGTDEKGNPLTESLKAPPPPLNYRFGEITRSLAPGAQFEVDQAELRIGAPIDGPRYWAFDGAPGSYRVGFSANFALGQNAKSAPMNLKSGLLPLQVTADAPPRSRFYLSEKTYIWGREVNGLQLGMRLEAPGQNFPAVEPVPLGTVVSFSLAVRNISQVPREIRYWRTGWSPAPRVFDEAGRPLFYNLLDPARSGPVFPVTQTLAPGEGVAFESARLSIGAPDDKEYSDPVLSAPPGKYRVRYAYDFTPDYHQKAVVTDPKTGEKTQPAKDENDVPWVEITIEIAPAQATKSPAP